MKLNKTGLEQLIKQVLLEESYSKFKKETTKRTGRESLGKAVKGVHTKLKEIEKLLEYTSRMKQELSENTEDLSYWKSTTKSVGQIAEIANRISSKIKDIYQ